MSDPPPLPLVLSPHHHHHQGVWTCPLLVVVLATFNVFWVGHSGEGIKICFPFRSLTKLPTMQGMGGPEEEGAPTAQQAQQGRQEKKEEDADALGKKARAWRGAVLRDFPACKQEVEAHFQCRSSSASMLRAPESACGATEALVAWCVVASFCPREATALRQCMRGDRLDFTSKPTHEEDVRQRARAGLVEGVPLLCLPSFRKFDQCLTRRSRSPSAPLPTET
jgi:hypothetical protein